MSRPIAARLLFISKGGKYEPGMSRCDHGENRTLKADNVRSKFLQNRIPVLEGIPSTVAISYINIVGAS